MDMIEYLVGNGSCPSFAQLGCVGNQFSIHIFQSLNKALHTDTIDMQPQSHTYTKSHDLYTTIPIQSHDHTLTSCDHMTHTH